jgi:hypothetical protein
MTGRNILSYLAVRFLLVGTFLGVFSNKSKIDNGILP